MRFSTLALAAFAASLCQQAVGQTTLKTEDFGYIAGTTDLTFAPGDPDRIFTVEKIGKIHVFVNGIQEATPFLDIESIVSSFGEQGLLGLAFHPDYQTNGRFFVNYTDVLGDTRVEEYGVSSNPNIAVPAGVQFITHVAQDFDNHNGGCIKFGPDGKLYVGMGDGGAQQDSLNRSQDPMQLLGKILRFDVDLPAPFIPPSNPYVGNPAVRDEIWHVGVRNPWRFSFDRSTGDMWIADVGEGDREEVDFIPAGQSGANLGWSCLEGTFCTGYGTCSCTDPLLLPPIHEYDHSFGCSITGGLVYRGSSISGFDGTYIFGDFCSGRIWSLRYDGANVTEFTERTAELQPQFGVLNSISTFGEDFNGDLYVVAFSGAIFKIVEDVPPCGFSNYCQANPTSAGPPAGIFGFGSSSISTNDFNVGATGLPIGTAGIFFYGPSQVQQPSGIGNVCVTGNTTMPAIRLYPAISADPMGMATRRVNFLDPQQSTGPGAIFAGTTLNFQFWFRDNQMGVATWNFTDGLSVVFCP